MRILNFIIVLALLLLFGAVIFLAMWEIPVPAINVERTISNDWLSR